MRTDVSLSTKFLTTQNAHQVGLLTTITGEQPASAKRPPINVALVLDCSGSMSGAPLDAAREAARRFVGFLGPDDRLSVVAFDEHVRVVHGPAAGGDRAVLGAIVALRPGGSTNLSGGWLMGMKLVSQGLVDGTNRVVLLPDGLANAGITDHAALAGMAAGGKERRVTTTCIGFGASFDEDLLSAMARAAGGNYWYVERDDQMSAIFEGEIEGLVALAAQNVEVEVRLTHPGAAGVSFLQGYPVTTTPDGRWRATLGDLYATAPLALGLVFHVEDVETLGKTQVAEVKVEADVVLERGIEHRTTVMPVWANLDGADHVEPAVEATFLRFEVAKAREEAVRRADGGDYAGAARVLRDVSARLDVPGDQLLADECRDLASEAERMSSRDYLAEDRKYLSARAMAAREMKESYMRKMRRNGER
jgi:Ca-activated chloride channel family protein